MSKILLIDIDGIVIRPRHKYFSQKYSEEHNVPLEEIMPFFKGKYKQAARGKVSIREILPSYLTKWGWKGDIESFLTYWFEGEKTIDTKVLELVRNLRKEGVKVYLVSDNEEERAKYIMGKLGLKEEFDGAFFSYQYGFTKGEPEFFQKVTESLKVSPDQIEYWDDDTKNVEVAKRVGINAQTYTIFEEFKNNNLL